MTTDELAEQMAVQLKNNVLLKDIRNDAAAKGFTPEQIHTALDHAHTLMQEQANRDPFIRLFMGPALLIIAYVAFYTDWAGRSVSIASFIGLVTLLIGGRLVYSLIKQWTRKSGNVNRQP